MFSLVKRKFNLDQERKRLLENFLSLVIVQGTNFILPFVTLPYLVRILGTDRFGLIAFAQAFIQYFNILTDYGFNLSATREISVNRDNKKKVSEIFSAVMIIKSFLLLLSFLILTGIILFADKFRKDWLVYYLTFGIVVGQVLFPIWFFQGVEKMKYVTLLNVITKVFFTVLVFLFIHRSSDYLYVPLINSLGFLVSGLLAMWIVFKNFNVRFILPDTKIIIKYFHDSSQFFISRVSVSVYTSTNAFVLGLFLGNKIVTYYTVAEKLYIGLQQLYLPLVNTLYPYVAYKRNVSLYKRIFKFATIANIMLIILLWNLSDRIVEVVFGSGLTISVSIFKILLLSALLVVPSILLGYPFLAALGYAKYANMSVVAGSLLHLVGLGILLIMGIINVYNVALMVVITEGFVLLIRLYGVKKNNLWRIN